MTRAFAEQQIPQFVAYWRDRNVPRHSWESKFIKEVWRQWQQAEATSYRRRQEVALTGDWRPSRDALQILIGQGGINSNFVEDAIPEFILYWRDRGDVSSTWDSKFIQHVRRQWQFYTGMMEQDRMPRAIRSPVATKGVSLRCTADGEHRAASSPSRLLPEFVLYWQENGTPQVLLEHQVSAVRKASVGAAHIQPPSTSSTADGKQHGSHPERSPPGSQHHRRALRPQLGKLNRPRPAPN